MLRVLRIPRSLPSTRQTRHSLLGTIAQIATLNAQKNAHISEEEVDHPESAEGIYQLARCLHMRQQAAEV